MKDPLVKELESIQRTNAYTDGDMAKLIGCSRQLYQATRKEDISVGWTITKGSIKVFPQLRNMAILFTGIPDNLPENAQDKQESRLERMFEVLYALYLKVRRVTKK